MVVECLGYGSNSEYPDCLYRGFTQQTVLPDGTLGGNAFDFKEFDNRGIEECSINWGDDEGALRQIAMQERDNGKKQFKFGACRIPRAEIDHIRGLAAAMARGFDYERRPVEGNLYHGNLLCKTSLSGANKRALCGMLAMLYDELYTRADLDQLCCEMPSQ